MTLAQLLNAITSTKIQVTLREANEVELIKFFTGGQNELSSALLARTVQVLKIENATAITVELKEVPTSM
jgi:hypothetical protein